MCRDVAAVGHPIEMQLGRVEIQGLRVLLWLAEEKVPANGDST